jgi:hypothetical protein
MRTADGGEVYTGSKDYDLKAIVAEDYGEGTQVGRGRAHRPTSSRYAQPPHLLPPAPCTPWPGGGRESFQPPTHPPSSTRSPLAHTPLCPVQDYYAVAVVNKDFCNNEPSFANLRGKRSCHTGAWDRPWQPLQGAGRPLES